MTFETFENRMVIEAELVAKTPIYIGAQADSFKPGSVNGSCVKDAYGKPYIPGSSLKGVLRAFLSRVMKEPPISVVDKEFEGKKEREKYGSQAELALSVYQHSTLVERLFGSKVMAGKIKIADAVIEGDEISTEVRNGVAIDRDTRTAVNGALFDTEVVPAGTIFRFRISAENLEVKELEVNKVKTSEVELFGKLMQYFADGNITIGGRSRAGLGYVKLRNIEGTVYYRGEDGFPVSQGVSSIQDAVKEVRKNVCRTN